MFSFNTLPVVKWTRGKQGGASGKLLYNCCPQLLMSSNYFKIVFSLLIAEKLQKEIWKVIVCLTINSNKKWHKISCVADKLSIFKNSSNYVLERWIFLIKKKVYMWGNNLILIFDLTYYLISLNGQVYCCCICLFPQVTLIGCPWKRMTENASCTAFI